MAELAGFPYFEVQFTKQGEPFDHRETAAALDAVRGGTIDELFVISHGWNNDVAEARSLYRAFFSQVRRALDAGGAPGLAGRRIAALSVLWPAKRFADEDLIPGGGASLGGGLDRAVQRQLDDLKGTFDQPDEAVLEQAKQLVPDLKRSPQAQREFVNLIRSVLPRPHDSTDDASDLFFNLPGDEVLRLLEPPILPVGGPGGGGGGALGIGLMEEGTAPAGGAAGIGDFFGGITAAARRLLNYATYYQMKERAGKIGMRGGHALLRQIKTANPDLRVHLVGHSFGGRLVTAAALGPPGSPSVAPASMTLLQAAFSHNGFALEFDGRRNGFFRNVVAKGRIAGPIVITHTVNDRAVGIAYPIASRIARQDASDLGDEDDVYGGIGRNGALHTPEAEPGELLDVGGRYAFAPGKLYNLRADALISGHSDVTGAAVVHAVLSAASG